MLFDISPRTDHHLVRQTRGKPRTVSLVLYQRPVSCEIDQPAPHIPFIFLSNVRVKLAGGSSPSLELSKCEVENCNSP